MELYEERELSMERCDFSSVITIIRRYISEDRNLNQVDLLYEFFVSFIADEISWDFDTGQYNF